MKCPYCQNSFEKVKILEGKYFAESVNDTKFEKVHVKSAAAFLCPKCETILSISSQLG
jgi:hypothetical protein